jgi:DNA-binding GntR family transcriptional regulator
MLHIKKQLRRVELAYFDAALRAQPSFREHAAIVRALKARFLPEARASLRCNWQGSLKRFATIQQRRQDGT